MANTNETPATQIRRVLGERGESIAWLSRETGIPYKRLLREVRHEARPLALETATSAAVALGVSLPYLVGEVAA